MRTRTFLKAGLTATAVTATALVGAALVPGVATGSTGSAGTGDQPVGAAVAELRKLVDPYTDVQRALADGFVPTEHCIPGMGYHYVNVERAMSGAVAADQPVILLYQPAKGGGLQLAGAEFMKPDADQDLSTDEDRPFLWGQPFDGPMAPHEPGTPAHYDLHVWTHVANPDGVLTAWNPRVSCSS